MPFLLLFLAELPPHTIDRAYPVIHLVLRASLDEKSTFGRDDPKGERVFLHGNGCDGMHSSEVDDSGKRVFLCTVRL